MVDFRIIAYLALQRLDIYSVTPKLLTLHKSPLELTPKFQLCKEAQPTILNSRPWSLHSPGLSFLTQTL